MRNIPGTELNVFPICLGGNVFGGRSTENESFAVLDAYVEAGGNFIDTADLYAGSESEMVIGRWMAARGNRDDLVIATKVGMMDGLDNLRPETIAKGCEDSLARLGTDRIDLFYTHRDDRETAIEDTARALADLVTLGKVRAIGASNFSAERLVTALDISRAEGLPSYVAVQPQYNLMERAFETDGLQALAERENLAVFPYYSLANGFLTGKHRPEGSDASSKRTERARTYLETDRGPRVLDALDEVANEHGTTPTAVALAWLLAQPTVTEPIASARIPEQVPDLIAGAELELGEGDLAKLDAASA
jgi:aryl-alcohol dehydrogenase-like predicted oxidoreductase